MFFTHLRSDLILKIMRKILTTVSGAEPETSPPAGRGGAGKFTAAALIPVLLGLGTRFPGLLGLGGLIGFRAPWVWGAS